MSSPKGVTYMRIWVSFALATTLTAEPVAALNACQDGEPPAYTLGMATSQPASLAWMKLDDLRGSTIVVRQQSDEEWTGRLISTSADSLVIVLKRGPQTLLRNEICEVIVSSRDRSKAIGWIVGLTLAGLAFGIVYGHVIERAPSPALTAAFGGGIGALIGSLPSDHIVYHGAPNCGSK
jgi:hypothetical protein